MGWGLWAGHGETEITEEHKSYISVLNKQILLRNPEVVKNNQIVIETKYQMETDLGLLKPLIDYELRNKDDEKKKRSQCCQRFFNSI